MGKTGLQPFPVMALYLQKTFVRMRVDELHSAHPFPYT